MQKENDNQISLIFIVNGTETIVEKVNIHQPLHVSVQKALDQSGNSRPITDWQVLFNDTTLDINKKIEDYGLTNNSVIFLSLRAGQGGI